MPVSRPKAPQRSVRVSRSVPVFFCLPFAISWTFWGLAIVAGDTPLGTFGYYGGGFGPLLAAAITTRVFGGLTLAWFKGLWRWRIAPKFWLFVLGFPVALALPASAVSGLLGGEVTLAGLGERAALWLPTFLTVTLIGGGNEEAG